MKICVYSIAKNEEEQLQRWYQSAKDADAIVLGDTGSFDNTVELSRSLGINTYELKLDCFRFDTAKNQLLKRIDADVYINLDLDEVLIGNWRALVENQYYFDLMQTLYERPNGELKTVTKIHSKNCTWKGCIHEFLDTHNEPRQIASADQVLFKHIPDLTKDRSNYFDLLKHSVYNELYEQNRAFNLYQYGLMLKDKKMYGEAITVLEAAAYQCSKHSPSNYQRIEQLISEIKDEYK